jgi:hypothetical protein
LFSVGQVYILSFLLLQADSIIEFLLFLNIEFRIILEQIYNCSIFNQAKKATYCCWLENPSSLVKNNTLNKRNKDCNNRNTVIAEFQLDQGCIYCKTEQQGNILICLQYIALNSNCNRTGWPVQGIT